MHKYLFGLGLLCLILCSCRDEYTICNESKYSILNGAFFKRTSSGDSTLKVPMLSILNLANGNYIYNQELNAAGFALPLAVGADSAKFSVKYSSNAAIDTITVNYTSAQEYLSLECGTIDVFDITRIRYTKHRIDTLKIVDPAVRNRSANNVKIYF